MVLWPMPVTTPLPSPERIREPAFSQHSEHYQRQKLGPTGGPKTEKLLEAMAELTTGMSTICSQIQEKKGLGGCTAYWLSGRTYRTGSAGHMSPSPPCSVPSTHFLKLHILASSFKGNRLWTAKYLLHPGTIWTEPRGDLLSCQLCSGRRK